MDRAETQTTLAALHQAHQDLAVRSARLLTRIQHLPLTAPEWGLLKHLTIKMETLQAMIDVCPDPALSARPPTDTRH